MANTLRPYLTCIRHTLTAAINLSSFSCEEVERYGRPEVEFQTNDHAMMNPVLITRNEREMCLIEASINSVRISVKIKQADELEELLAKKYVMFLQQRAETFAILRRKPLDGFDLSFLITNEHLIAMDKSKVVNFLVQFLEDIDRELSALKLSVNTRGRAVAAEFLKSFK